MKSFENTPNTDRMINKNNLQSEIIQNNNILINFPLKSNNIIFNEKKKKQENINIIPIDKKKYFYFGEIGIIKGDTRKMINKESNPTDNFNITEFQIIKQIGKGGFGKIYCIKWIKNNRLYALKKYNLIKNELNYFKAKVEILKYLTKKIEDNNGFIKIYGDKCIQQKNPNEIHYYIIMELGERDWFKELKIREAYFMHYSENELFDIITQLVKTLSLMQKNNITHRDIKLQNIILCKGIYKLCDFDESEIVNQNTEVCQTIKGSKLYMSPILYYALKRKEENVIHNPYKSDVFSLGMCSLFAASFTRKLLCDIREIKDMNLISKIVNKALNKRYSHKFINLIVKMLQLDEKLRFDFLELEEYIAKI
jgi:serine/threonine protein kinase